jgi:HPt (histidine-containing phosphotransfer) domain-containing protein
MMDGTYDYQTKRDSIHVAASERNAELSNTIAQLYVDAVPVLVQVMRDASSQGDLRELFRAADALRLSSTNLGALRLAELCQNICDLRSKDQLGTVAMQLAEIAQTAAKVCAVIERNRFVVAVQEFA